MVKRVSIVGHTAAQADEYTGAVREITVDTTANELRVHDGATPGGHRLMNAAAIAAAYFSLSETQLNIDTINEKTLGNGVTIEGVHFEDTDVSGVDDIALNTINGVDFDVFEDAMAAHIANVSNPHAVTKTQVGLANVTNDAQLKIASNLSDVANALTAFNNVKQSASDSYAGVMELGILSETDQAVSTRVVVPAILELLHGKGANIASVAGNLPKPADADRGGFYHITGTLQVEGLWSTTDFPWPQYFIADGALPLKHSSSFLLPNGLDVTLSAGDGFLAFPEGGDIWRVILFRAGATTKVVAVTTAQSPTLIDNGKTYIFTGAGGVNFNLPVLADTIGCDFTIVNQTSGNITIDGNGAEQLDSLTTRVLKPGDRATVANITTQWITVRGRYSFLSAQQTPALSTPYTIAHGLGLAPNRVRMRYICIVAINGWTVNDELYAEFDEATYGKYLSADATNVYTNQNQTYYDSYASKTTGQGGPDLTPTNWRFVVEAFWERL